MKKSIGLTADVSTFNTTLPQTRHLNYFMNTNPRGFAKGGDVSQGIPNYPNPNVTNGFLPMALGFAPGGEVDSGLLEQIDKLILLLGGDMKKVIKYLKTFFGYSDEQINSALNKKNAQPPMGAVDTQPQPVAPKQPLTPKDTVTSTPETPYGAVDVTPDPTSPKMPDNIPTQSLPGPVGSGIIPLDTQYRPEIPDAQPPAGAVDVTGKPTEPKKELPLYKKVFDINDDGKVDMEDYNMAKEKGLSIADAILKYIQGFVDEAITPDKVEVPGQGGPVDTIPSPVKPKEKPKVDDNENKIKPKLKIKPPQDNITTDEQNTFKNSAEFFGKSNQEQMEIANKGGITALDPSKPDKTKKDVPAWALPMMSAGFAMMASKSPYFMQSLGEAGQAGVETYTAQKTAEEDKLDKESTRNLQKAQADSYTNKVSGTPFVHSSGYLYRYRGDQAIPLLDERGQKIRSIPTDAEIIKSLTTEMGIQFTSLSDVEQRALIEKRKNLLLGQIQNSLSNTEGSDSGDGSFWKDKIDGILKYIEGVQNAKDGGIITIRR
jgi:hypothetical protein